MSIQRYEGKMGAKNASQNGVDKKCFPKLDLKSLSGALFLSISVLLPNIFISNEVKADGRVLLPRFSASCETNNDSFIPNCIAHTDKAPGIDGGKQVVKLRDGYGDIILQNIQGVRGVCDFLNGYVLTHNNGSNSLFIKFTGKDGLNGFVNAESVRNTNLEKFICKKDSNNCSLKSSNTNEDQETNLGKMPKLKLSGSLSVNSLVETKSGNNASFEATTSDGVISGTNWELRDGVVHFYGDPYPAFHFTFGPNK